jgi:hypothetical protein
MHRLLVRKPEGSRPLGRPRQRWVENIKMDLGEIERAGIDWIGLAQDRPVEGPCESGIEPSDSKKC